MKFYSETDLATANQMTEQHKLIITAQEKSVDATTDLQVAHFKATSIEIFLVVILMCIFQLNLSWKLEKLKEKLDLPNSWLYRLVRKLRS